MPDQVVTGIKTDRCHCVPALVQNVWRWKPVRAVGFPPGLPQLPYWNVTPGFGHVGLGGSVGSTDPVDAPPFAFAHNRLLTPFVMTEHAGFVGLYAPIRQAAAKTRKRGLRPVTEFGSPSPEPGAVAGRLGRPDDEASSAPDGDAIAILAPLWLGVR
jgi:hypothetical protein